MMIAFMNVPSGGKFVQSGVEYTKRDNVGVTPLGVVQEFLRSTPVELIGHGWREATLHEYANVTAISGCDKRISPSARVMTVEWYFCGHKIAEKVEVAKRGKTQSVSLYIDPAFLSDMTMEGRKS